MKKFIKICLITAGVCAGVGIIFCVIAFAMGGYHSVYQLASEGKLSYGKWYISTDGIYYGNNKKEKEEWENRQEEEEWEALEKAEWEEESEAVSVGKEKAVGANGIQYVYETAGIKNLSVDIGAAEVVFTEGARTDAIVVTLYNCKKENFEGTLGETLYLGYGAQYNQVLVGKNKDKRIIVEIPAEMRFDVVDADIGAVNASFASDVVKCRVLQLDIGAGNVKADSFAVEEELNVDIGAGNVEISGGTYGDMKLSCGLGNFSIQGAASGDITAECGMGNMELYLEGNPDSYDYQFSCGAGKLVVNGVTYAGIAGEYEIKNEGAERAAELSCGMGNLNFSMEERK